MPNQPTPVEILQSLVRNASLSGHEGGAADAAENAMREAGFDRVWRDAAGNLVGELHGSQPGGKLVFDAHMDVVPAVDAEKWTHDPFSGEFQDGRVWGRGATDNKGSLAAMIAGLSALPRTEFKGVIYVVGSVGEETFEGIGLQQVVDALRPDLVVIGEPTHCNLGFGQRGRARVTFRVPGRAAHSSSDDQSGNAVYAMAALAEKLSRHTFPSDPSLGRGSHAPIELISSPFPSLSTVPAECRLTLDRRLMPGETAESILADYRATVSGIPGASVEMDRVTYTSYTGEKFTREDFHPAWDSGKRHGTRSKLPGCTAFRGIFPRSFVRCPIAPMQATAPACWASQRLFLDPGISSRRIPSMNSSKFPSWNWLSGGIKRWRGDSLNKIYTLSFNPPGYLPPSRRSFPQAGRG